MTFDDRITIETPENVTLEVMLAGVGSRMAAALLDGLIRAAVITAFGVVLFATTDDTDPARTAIFAVVYFVMTFCYDVAFEVLGRGRTPGKRATGLRVVREHGEPVGFVASAIRTLLRLVDGLPGMYAVGIVAVLLSRKNQRLGDMAAGTIVIRERTDVVTPAWSPAEAAAHPDDAWDVAAVTRDELATARAFLARREQLVPEARTRVGLELATRLRAKVAGAPAELSPEQFLERLVAAKARRS